MNSIDKILTSAGKFRISLGLDRIKKILSLLDNPQKNCKFIHIAGTNGKGSTSKIINDILIEHFRKTNIKIGLFTSPHLFSYTERIKINNVEIKQDKLSKLINEINELALKNGIDLTEFELLTSGAFKYFSDNRVEYVVMEVGLGGLYDATNVINPIVEVITAIDFDHTERLGKTIEEIAAQKAGIIKENSKVAVLKSNLGYKVIKNEAIKKNSKLVEMPNVEIKFQDFENNFAIINNKSYKFNLLGQHQKDNLALAIGAIQALEIKVEDETIKKALEKVQWKFRLEYLKDKNLLIDGAHNPNGICALKKFLDENVKEDKTIIFGCLRNKDYSKMLEILLENENKFYFFEFDYPNALKFDELPDEYKKKANLIKDIKEIKNIINSNKTFKVICGSLYMLGQVFK